MAKRYRSVLELAQENSTPEFASQLEQHLQERAVARALFVLRNREKLIQAELAQRMGCPQSRVSKLEHATNKSLRLGDLECFLTSLGYTLELRVMPKANAATEWIQQEGRPMASKCRLTNEHACEASESEGGP